MLSSTSGLNFSKGLLPIIACRSRVYLKSFSVLSKRTAFKVLNFCPTSQSARVLYACPQVDSILRKGFLDHKPNSLLIASFSTEENNSKQYEFQAETRQLLDIVTHSLYTDKEVFLRELISNASDSLEKLRHLQATGEQINDPELPLEIKITTNEALKTLTIQDSGIGMTKEELSLNLGTIARSGSRAFVKELKEKGSSKLDASGIIGQFGVGFYSAFMVGSEVSVLSKAAKVSSSDPNLWKSKGEGSYQLRTVEGADAQRGCKIVINLKDGMEEYCKKSRIEEIIRKYSNFVNFPIRLDGDVVNTIQAVWAQDKSEVTEDQYKQFYKFIANAYDDQLFTLHFRADAPLDVKALLFFPSFHTEKLGMGRMEPGCSLYSRKVLITSKSPDILPEWLRFIKGVVDSEDLPLSISREKPQDSRLMARLQDVLVRKILRFLDEAARKDPETFKKKFIPEFDFFLKEGICRDLKYQDQLSKLLHYESSKGEANELYSLDDYIGRCTPEQNEIYYLCAPSREMAEASPYFEIFKKEGKEVIFLYSAIDDFVMSNLKEYQGKKLVSAESSELELGKASAKDKNTEGLSKKQAKALCDWLLKELPDKLSSVKVTHRLGDSPAIITGHESGEMRRMMKMVAMQTTKIAQFFPKQDMEINPNHEVIMNLDALRDDDPDVAALVAEQMYDNALVAAGLMDDSRTMLPRLNALLAEVLKAKTNKSENSTDKSS